MEPKCDRASDDGGAHASHEESISDADPQRPGPAKNQPKQTGCLCCGHPLTGDRICRNCGFPTCPGCGDV